MNFDFTLSSFFRTSKTITIYIDEETLSIMQKKRDGNNIDLNQLSQHSTLNETKDAFFKLVEKFANQHYKFFSRVTGQIKLLNQPVKFLSDYERKFDFKQILKQGKENAENWSFNLSPVIIK